MSFYGLANKDDTAAVLEHLTAVKALYDKGGQQTFFGDNMAALGRTMSFAADADFFAAFEANARDTLDRTKVWRLHTYCWAGRTALAVPGDFVECGVYEGFYASVLLRTLGFERVAKRMLLFDTFSGLSEKYSSAAERRVVGDAYAGQEGWYERVKQRFAAYGNVTITRGVVPDVLAGGVPEAIALLHLDMNAGAAEVGALEVLFERVSEGGLIVMDDYGREEMRDLHENLRDWMAAKGHPILELPTGQGLVIKRG
jgi:hypothetical protein